MIKSTLMNSVMGIRWNSLAGETTTQQQTQSQAQGDSNVRVDGSHNNVVIAPRQTQEQAASSRQRF